MTSCLSSKLTECDIFVQCGFKVASKAMEHRVTTHRESEALIPIIVHIWVKKEMVGNIFTSHDGNVYSVRVSKCTM